jgi:Double-GTPase 2
MSLTCKHADCDPQFMQCLLGDSVETCKNVHRNENPEPTSSSETEEPYETVAWSGNTLGTKNLHVIAARNSAYMIGLIGPHDSGKTTYLGLLWRRLLNGDRLGEFRFAGSFTLAAWMAISDGFKWPQRGLSFRFPAHTSLTQTGRVPGLLHLALRDPRGRIRDILFTDSPGEWFTDWATNKVNERAEGARWIHEHADAFMVFADAKRLSGSERGPAREEVNRILQRLGDGLRARPVAIAWSKADLPISEAMKGQIQKEALRIAPAYTCFDISYKEPFLPNYADSATWLLDQAMQPKSMTFDIPRSKSKDFFFQIR